MAGFVPESWSTRRDATVFYGPRVMGILNVTPDSFSDGGRYAGVSASVVHALQMANEGATWIDVGGESTRPGSAPVPADEETRESYVRALCAEIAGAGSPAWERALGHAPAGNTDDGREQQQGY